MKPIFDAIRYGLDANANGDACRLFHGRGQSYEGLGFVNVDWFRPVLLVTLYQDPGEEWWRVFTTGLNDVESRVACIVVQRRFLRGSPIAICYGKIPDSIVACEENLEYQLNFSRNQNIGFFMDMSPGRRWLQQLANDKKVLNLFSYTCSLSVVAIEGGAKEVVNVDMSSAALNVGRSNHRLNKHDSQLKRDIQFLPHNIFRSWKKIISKGPYDIVVIDPPSRQKGSFEAEKDYIRVLRRLPALMPNGGDVLICLNAPEYGESFLKDLVDQSEIKAEFVTRLKNRSDFPEADIQRSVKMLHYRLPITCL